MGNRLPPYTPVDGTRCNSACAFAYKILISGIGAAGSLAVPVRTVKKMIPKCLTEWTLNLHTNLHANIHAE